MDSEGWGRTFLARCGVNPDDETDVRATYENCRESAADAAIELCALFNRMSVRERAATLAYNDGFLPVPSVPN